MDTGQDSKPRPTASPPLARKGGRSVHRSSERSGSGPAEIHLKGACHDRVIAKKEVQREIPNILCEVFREEISYRAQARKFLWEFFD